MTLNSLGVLSNELQTYFKPILLRPVRRYCLHISSNYFEVIRTTHFALLKNVVPLESTRSSILLLRGSLAKIQQSISLLKISKIIEKSGIASRVKTLAKTLTPLPPSFLLLFSHFLHFCVSTILFCNFCLFNEL